MHRPVASLADTEARFVDDGDVVTSAGVSAGIDMALHLVARLESVDEAQAVRRGIQYDPQPPVLTRRPVGTLDPVTRQIQTGPRHAPPATRRARPAAASTRP